MPTVRHPTPLTCSLGRGAVRASSGRTAVALLLAACSGTEDTDTVERGELVAISITPFSPTLQVGEEQTMQVRGFYEDESSVLIDATTWVSEDERVVSIDAGGVATAQAEGSATVVAAVGELGARTTVRVREPSDAPVSIVAVPAQIELRVGGTVAISANATFEDGQTGNIAGQCGWSSSDAAIATVNDGLVVAIRPGTTTIDIDCGPRSPSPVPVQVVSDSEESSPPDVTVTFFEATVSGADVQYDVVVSNTGQGPALGFWVDLVVDSSTAPTVNMPIDDLAWIPELSPGASVPLQFVLSELPAGERQSWVSVDSDDRIDEANENNNIAGPIAVSISTARPDLVVEDFDALSDGESTFYEATIRNSGAASTGGFWVDLFLDRSTDPVIDDLGDDFVWVESLAPGGTQTVEFLVEQAPTTSWSSVLFADTNADVQEADESNNQARTTVSE